MRVDDVMSPAKCCSPDDTVQSCARLMKDENIGFVPVCDRDGKPIGAITDRDLAIRVLADGKTGNEKIDRYVTREVVGCRTGDDIQDAARLMREHQVSRVMVCDDAGKLQGVISLQDLAEEESDEMAGRTLTDVKADQPTAH
jgi:CBS domain-containing protein